MKVTFIQRSWGSDDTQVTLEKGVIPPIHSLMKMPSVDKLGNPVNHVVRDWAVEKIESELVFVANAYFEQRFTVFLSIVNGSMGDM